MRTHLRPIVLAIGVVVVAVGSLHGAQTQPQEPSRAVAEGRAAAEQVRERDLAAIMALKVKIVLSKYQGQKKVGSLPYEMAVRTDGTTSNIRMGTQVPVPGFGAATPDVNGKPAPRIGPFSYKDVGTNIDCRVTNLDSGRYAVTLTIEDSSVYTDDQVSSQVAGVPSFRSFRTLNSLILRDGQTTEFTAAADKMSGEVIRAEVTLTVIK